MSIRIKQVKQVKQMKRNAIAYIRVSTSKQETEAQLSAITLAVSKVGLQLTEVVEETISSRKKDREIYRVVERLSAGDTLYAYELSRIGRSLSEVLNIVETVKSKKASLVILSPQPMKLGFGLTSAEEIQAETMIFALGIGSRIERDLISERTKNALRERRSQGVTLGRPIGRGKKVEKAIASKGLEIDKLIEFGLSATKIGKLLEVDRRTVSAYIQERQKHGKRNKRTL